MVLGGLLSSAFGKNHQKNSKVSACTCAAYARACERAWFTVFCMYVIYHMAVHENRATNGDFTITFTVNSISKTEKFEIL